MLVEDDAFTRSMMAASLRARGIEVAVEAGSANEAAKASQDQRLDVAVLDLHLGEGPTGIDVAQALRRRQPSIGVVFLTSFEQPRMLSANLPVLPGNSFYLHKSKIGDVSTLIDTMVSAAKGQSAPKTQDATSPLGRFTDVQLETLRLVAQGYSNSEIAKIRFVTERSVEISISRVAKALGLAPDASRNQRVHMAKVFFRALGRSPVDQG